MTLGEIRILTDDLVGVQKAAKQLGITRMTLYRWIDAKKVVSIKLGGIRFIPRTEIERLENEWRQEAELKEKEKQEAEQKRRAEIERLENELERLKNSEAKS